MATYLGLFESAVGGADKEVQSRLLAALLTGLARAQPYLASDFAAASPGGASPGASPASAKEGAAGKEAAGGAGGASLVSHLDSIFKVVHVGSFSASTQALSILHHLAMTAQAHGKSTDPAPKKTKNPAQAKAGSEGGAKQLAQRFYRTLYGKLGSPDFLSAAKPTLFLNLVFKVGLVLKLELALS